MTYEHYIALTLETYFQSLQPLMASRGTIINRESFMTMMLMPVMTPLAIAQLHCSGIPVLALAPVGIPAANALQLNGARH